MDYLKELENQLSSTASKLHEELTTVRSNRPSVGLIEDIKVECYGQTLTIKELGSLAVRPPRLIEVSIWDKGAVGPVVGAIESAKIGVSVTNDGNVIRVSLPSLTDERRAEFMKLVKKMAESAKIQIRAHRDEAMKKIKALQDEKELSEDQAFKGKEQVQKLVDGANNKVDGSLDGKLKELSE